MPPFVPSVINTPKDLILVHLLFGGLIFIGIFIKLLSTIIGTDSAIGEATITTWGYIIILFSLLGLVIIQIDPNQPSFQEIQKIPYTLYVLAVIIIWIILLNVTYTKSINKNTIPPSYKFWNIWSTVFISIITILILLQLFSTLYTDEIEKINIKWLLDLIKDNNTNINVYLGFILFLNVIITGIQTVILSSFTVDG